MSWHHVLLLLLHGLLCGHGHASGLGSQQLLASLLEPLQQQWGLWLLPMLELLHDLCQFWAHQLAEEPRHRPEHVRVGGDRPLSSSEHVAHPLPLRAFATSLSIHGCTVKSEVQSVKCEV